MRVLVIGGTGFLGTHLLPKLLEQGHDVTVLTRSKDNACSLESRGVSRVVGDLLDPEPFMLKLKPQDAVICIAMPDIQPGRISRKRFRALQKQTTAYFSTPIAVAEKLGCPLIVTLGTSFRTTGGQVADESWPIERFGMTRIGEFVDPLIAQVMDRGSPPIIHMLPGEIYGPGGLFRMMYDWMKKGRYPVIGSGQNYIPRIHVKDCASAYVKALDKLPIGERFIIADDSPCTVREFADFMAECMDVPKPRSVPRFIIRVVVGKLVCETITMNCRVSNAKAKMHLDWELIYPTYRDGLPAVIAELEDTQPQAR